MKTFAAIDVGSNAMRMAVAVFSVRGVREIVVSHREPIRLGVDVFEYGYIREETIERSIAAFFMFKQLAKKHRVELVRAIGTSALRDAQNRDEFVDRIERSTGIRIEPIDGAEEARIIHVAVKAAVDLTPKLALLIDIGGGSVEISLVSKGDLVVSDSVNMGTVRLLQMMRSRNPSRKLFERLIRDYARGVRRQVQARIEHRRIQLCVGTGGNIETFGELRRSMLGATRADRIKTSELDEIVPRLQELSVDQRITSLDLRPDRADVIVPAGVLLQAILHEAHIEEMLIPGVSLKDGVLIDLFETNSRSRRTASRTERARRVMVFAREFGRRFGIDERHAATTERLSSELFDKLKTVHGCGLESRLLLQVASVLHDVGKCIDSNDHHKHSQYIIKEAPFVGLSKRECALVAAIARFHRKSAPRLDHEGLTGLEMRERIIVTRMAALLRIANALDVQHADKVRGIRVVKGKTTVKLELDLDGPGLLERWAVSERGKLFESVFKKKLEIG